MNAQNCSQLNTRLEELAQAGDELQKKHDDVETATLPVLAKCLGIYRAQFHASESDSAAVEEKILVLKKKLDEKKIRYLEKSPPLNLLIRLVTGKNTERGSAYSRVVESAFNRGVTEDKFVGWVEDNHGIEAIRKNMPRNPNDKSDSSGTDETTAEMPKKKSINTSLYATYARQEVGKKPIAIIDEDSFSEKLEKPVVETEYAAILVHNIDGTLEIKTMLKDNCATEFVFARVACDKGWDKIADANEQRRQLDDLLKKETLKLVDLREISEDLAKDCQMRWAAERDMAEHYRDIPIELDPYRAYLKRGDACENMRADSGEKYFEKALEALKDAIEINPNLQDYFEPQFTPDINPNAESMPRFKISKSKRLDAAGGSYRLKQQEVFRQVIQSHLEQLTHTQSEDHSDVGAGNWMAARLAVVRTRSRHSNA